MNNHKTIWSKGLMIYQVVVAQVHNNNKKTKKKMWINKTIKNKIAEKFLLGYKYDFMINTFKILQI